MLIPFFPHRLADSPWPRAEGDAGNRRLASCDGPRALRVLHRTVLPESSAGPSGCAAGDGLLHLRHGDWLCSFGPGAERRWALRLPREPGEERRPAGLPAALHGGACAVAVGARLLVVDARGQAIGSFRRTGGPFSSAGSPNGTPDGRLALVAADGELDLLLRDDMVAFAGRRAAPVVDEPVARASTPAVYADGSFAFCDGGGLKRVDPRGGLRWSGVPARTDRAPVLSTTEVCGAADGVGSTLFLDGQGRLLAELPLEAELCARPDGGWLALGAAGLLALDEGLEPLWRLDLAGGEHAPACDGSGWSLCWDEDGILHLVDARGTRREKRRFGRPAAPPAVVAPGLAALVMEDELLLLG